ncbi:MAG TPA: hypothetical protein VGN82_05675 [Bosea sp. (in: a-proteobacteria)]|jgi:hypothetical protein|uniref:hypothetical protein n=1 Tax=Bosea sp. (in: a-proteobacteria) TaxID=1871050 RepID=UPI002E137502|nr:hypothetical protein [Bosea sp. (in: a-proteobacteria)]
MAAGGLRRAGAAVGSYAAHPDPRAAIANTVALVIVSNQPFYPLYLCWAVSPVIAPSYLTFLSTPFFAAVPAAMRYSPRLGRSLLLVAGIGNTALCRVAFGQGSGVEVFLFPCLVLALLLFRRAERAFTLGFVALSFTAYLLPAASLSAPLHLYEPAEYAALQRLNFLSAASLTVLIGWLFVSRLATISDPDETEGRRRA